MKHWSAEFRPRSICNYGSDGDSGPSGDTGGGYTGDTGGDFFGSSDGGFYGTGDSGSFIGGDTAPGATGGDSWTGSESGAGQFASSDPGGFFGDSGPVSSDTGGGYYSGGGSEGGFIGPGGDYSGGGYDYSGSPYADYGPGPSFAGGVDFSGSGMGFGYGPGTAGNMGIGNAVGPAGWATGDFGAYGAGGPTSTGFGPGAGPSIGGPGYYGGPDAAPGILGFQGDFGAPPGGAFGMPAAQGDVGPQAGPGMPGGPGTVGNAEPGFVPTGPEVQSPDQVAPTRGDDRTEVDPTTVFGPEFATNQAGANAGWFGPSQAQAGQNMTNQGVIDAAMFANDFGRTGADMSAYMAATNPGLAQALSQIATNFNADPANDPANYAGPSPGAQQGFTGTSAQQGTTSFDSFGGKGDNQNPSGRADVQQTNPNFDLIGPMVTQQGYQQLAAEMNAQQQPQDARPAGYQMLADQMTQQQNQQNMVAAQELGEQGKGAPTAQTTPQQTISNAFEALTAANQQQAMQQAAPFDAQARGEQDRAGRADDTFDSRFGNFPMTADMFDAQSRGEQGKGEQLAPWAQNETIGLRPGEDVISNLNPFTLGVGREAAPLGLWSMANEPTGRPGGSPTGMPSTGPFGPPGGRPGGQESAGRPGLSITVGGRPGGGYYNTGGAGIAPGAKGAEYGGAYGKNSPGLPGTAGFGGDFRQGGGGWFYDPGTGQYFQAGASRR